MDYKGRPNANVHRSQSVNLTPNSGYSRNNQSFVVEIRNQFMMQNERPYGKKVSLNMKNYSSLSIGENDDLRRVYEKSA